MPERVAVFDEIPDDSGLRDDASARMKIDSGGALQAGTVAALLRYGGCDRYYFLTPSPGPQPLLAPFAEQMAAGRVVLLSLREAAQLAEHERAVLLSRTENTGRLAALRSAFPARAWPVIGQVQALEPGAFLAGFSRAALAGFGPGDALVCSTAATARMTSLLIRQIQALVLGQEAPGEALPRLPVIPPGVDCDELQAARRNRVSARRALDLPEHAPVALHVGRFERYGKCDLLPLLRSFARAGKGGLLVLAGCDLRGDLAKPVWQEALSLGIAGSVRVVEDLTHSRKLELYAAADLFLAPVDGVSEVQGIFHPLHTLVEAMASGLPVVAFDWSETREMVEHGQTGFLVSTSWPALDGLEELEECFGVPAVQTLAMAATIDTAALEEALSTLVSSASLRQRMGRAAAAQARARFHWPTVVRRHEELWQESWDDQKRRPQRAQPAPGVYQHIFQGHPSGELPGSIPLFTAEPGEGWSGAFVLPGMAGDPHPFLRPDLFEEIHAVIVAAGPGLHLNELERILHERKVAGPFEVRLHVARLLKYDLVRPGAGPTEAERGSRCTS